jgi:hypothetical protein
VARFVMRFVALDFSDCGHLAENLAQLFEPLTNLQVANLLQRHAYTRWKQNKERASCFGVSGHESATDAAGKTGMVHKDEHSRILAGQAELGTCQEIIFCLAAVELMQFRGRIAFCAFEGCDKGRTLGGGRNRRIFVRRHQGTEYCSSTCSSRPGHNAFSDSRKIAMR